ncbi:MAG TPA: hypothetical protein VHT71_13240 [Methylomirabilota bacterium]|jgi:hypothetical protein|nr:hypothetical protein [Methylomirabilota bacterium]
MIRRGMRLALVLVLVASSAGCSAVASPPPRGAQPPRARCLSDPNETGARPLFFLFCIESP